MLELKNITQKYGEKVIFDDFSLKIDKGFTAIMGESGCGKSTVLRYFTGLQTPTSGGIFINDVAITPTDTIPMVFQERSCLDHMSVLDNVALPLIIKGVAKKEAQEKAMEMIKVVNLEGQESKYAKYPTLSGGQLQRVAIARSLVANPSVLIMDEPFSSLDSTTRRKMQDFLKELFYKVAGSTFIIVTHDEREAAYLADNVIVMAANPGHVKEFINLGNLSRNDPKLFQAVNYIESIV